MSSTIEKFRDRVNAAQVLEIPLIAGSSEVILKVKRFNAACHNAARKDAEAVLFKLGLLQPNEFIDATHPAYKRYIIEYWEALALQVKRHVKDWTHTPPEGVAKIEYSEGKLTEFYEKLGSGELQDLGWAYFDADQAEEKKKEAATTTATSSSSDSMSGSVTS